MEQMTSLADHGKGRRKINLAVFIEIIYPYGFKVEALAMLQIAWPIVLTHVAQFLTIFISILFSGQLGKVALDSVSLAMTIVYVWGFSILEGLSTALDTLFTQIYGSENKTKIGIVLQQSVLIMSLISLPCAAIFLNTEYILEVIGQHQDVARMAGRYNTVFVFSLPGYIFSLILSKYLQSQSIVQPSLFITLICNGFNAGAQALLIFKFSVGVLGPAISTMVTFNLIAVLHFAYIYCSGVHKDTWNGWTWECLNGWKQYIALAVPGFLMIAMEWWEYSVLILLSGLIGIKDLAANTITYNLSTMFYMGPLGLSIAACVRVGNHLGAGDARRALTASRVAIFMAATLGLIYCVFLVAAADVLPYLFSNESDVIELASSLMYQLALLIVFDCMVGTLSGILRGMGRQKFGAIYKFITYYLLALPVSISLLLISPLGVKGAWWGMMLGSGGAFIIFTIRVARADWHKEAENAESHTGTDTSKTRRSNEIKEMNNMENGNLGRLNVGYEREESCGSVAEHTINHEVQGDTSATNVNGNHSIQNPEPPSNASLYEDSTRRVRLAQAFVLVLFIIIFVSGIILRVYLDNMKSNPKTLNITAVNSTSMDNTTLCTTRPNIVMLTTASPENNTSNTTFSDNTDLDTTI